MALNTLRGSLGLKIRHHRCLDCLRALIQTYSVCSHLPEVTDAETGGAGLLLAVLQGGQYLRAEDIPCDCDGRVDPGALLTAAPPHPPFKYKGAACPPQVRHTPSVIFIFPNTLRIPNMPFAESDLVNRCGSTATSKSGKSLQEGSRGRRPKYCIIECCSSWKRPTNSD
jgi:hypothetical protein